MSAETHRPLNAFVQRTNKSVSGFSKDEDGNQPKPDIKSKPVGRTTPKQIVEMQNALYKTKTIPSSQRTLSTTTDKNKSSAGSSAGYAGQSGAQRRPEQSFFGDQPNKLQSKMDVRKNPTKDVGPAKASALSEGKRAVGKNLASAEASKGKTTTSNQQTASNMSKGAAPKSRKAPVGPSQSLKRTTSHQGNEGKPRSSQALNKVHYFSSSSSGDECTSPPRGLEEAPSSPASKAKTWNEIYSSPGPTHPGWKFRSPPEGRQFSQIGAKELSAMFQNLKTEGEAKAGESATKGSSKFTDYMRKMKTSSRICDEMSSASLQQDFELKKIYAQQLDAMRQKAWNSLQALEADFKNAVDPSLNTNFDKLAEGTSRIPPNGLTVADVAMTWGGNFKEHGRKKPVEKSFVQSNVVQADDMSSDDSDDMEKPSPPLSEQLLPKGKKSAVGSTPKTRKGTKKSTRQRTMARGDGCHDLDSSPDSECSPRPSGVGDSPPSGNDGRSKPKRPEESRMVSRVTSDQLKSLAEGDPLKKLKEISQKLQMDHARMLSRRAPEAIKFSSSDDDSDDYNDLKCT